jgi:diguanylate cyclase (GGDEF)-like protein
MFPRFLLIALEVVFITLLDYKMAEHYYSLDVLYCLPVIQTARFNAFQSLRRSDSQTITMVAVVCALAWCLAEAAVSWPNFPMGAFLMNVITRSVTFAVIGRVVARMWKDRGQNYRDELTGLMNRSEFIKRFEVWQAKSEATNTPYSLLSVDIDRFSTLNNKHGHETGDKALKLLADTLRENSRNDDLISRMGSDEFVLLLPETDKQSAKQLGVRIAQIAGTKFRAQGWDISLSFGQVTETGKQHSMDELLREASEQIHLDKTSKLAAMQAMVAQ